MSVSSWPGDQGQDAGLLIAARTAFATIGAQQVAVAVSGGGDSIALLHLIYRAAPCAGWIVSAVTVDHGLRPEAAVEAAEVARFCASLGIAHSTLRWDHGEITGNLMDAARQARMRLMADWALAHGITRIALGHTADDQAETFLMGLGRASGLDGLVGMRTCWRRDYVDWSRPLLAHSRAELRAYLRRHNIAWVDDPTNEDDRYTRIKARRALAALASLGITAKSLTTSMNHLSQAMQVVENAVQVAVAAYVTEAAGGLTIARAGYDALPYDVQRRLLVAGIGWMSGNPYPPRMAAQGMLHRKIEAGLDTTLNGCRFRCKGDLVHIVREPKAVLGLSCATDQIWDTRWRITGPPAPGLTLRALGAEGLRLCKNWRNTGLSRDALLVSPAVWQGDALISAPVAGFNPEWSATIPIGFAKFVLSH